MLLGMSSVVPHHVAIPIAYNSLSHQQPCRCDCIQVVQDTKAEMAERNDELLSSFNVATFKSDEDDQAFWNRLIPVDQRAKDQPEAQEHLGIRTARLSKFADDVSLPLLNSSATLTLTLTNQT